MKILFFIYSSGNASGGHFHSLHHITMELSKKYDVAIVSLGPNEGKIITSNPFFLKHIKLNGCIKQLINLNLIIKTIIKGFNPDILHCFDTKSLNWIILLPSTFNYPVVLNKCGGPNPLRMNYQHANAIVVFSGENYHWFKNNKKYGNEPIYVIPNRVKKLEYLPKSNRKETKDKNKITFVRIARLGGVYEKTLKDTLQMIEALKERYPVELIVVGEINDISSFKRFKDIVKQKKLPVKFITDDRAKRGSDFLYLADFVIGTGRSLIEALSLGIPVLTPAKNSDWPVLLDNDNFNIFFFTNFSERNVADRESLASNQRKIESLLNNKNEFLKAQNNAFKIFNEYYNNELITIKYYNVYKDILEAKNERLKVILKNVPYVFKQLFEYIWHRSIKHRIL
jgi:glycosyltransferase involved in cell wall biosynthesis